MNERIAELLTVLKEEKDIKQFEIAKRLGVTEAAVSAWKNGRRNVTEQISKSICREFGVNPSWLNDGVGNMFIDNDEDFRKNIDRIMKGESETRKNLFKALIDASDDDIEALDRIITLYVNFRNDGIDHIQGTISELYEEVPKTPEELEAKFPPVKRRKDAG